MLTPALAGFFGVHTGSSVLTPEILGCFHGFVVEVQSLIWDLLIVGTAKEDFKG